MGLLAALQVISVGMALCCCSLTTVGSVSLHAALQESTLGLCAAPCCFGLTRVGSAGLRQPCKAASNAFCAAPCCFSPVIQCHSLTNSGLSLVCRWHCRTATGIKQRRPCLRSCSADMLSCSSRLGRQVGADWAGTGP